MTYLSPDTHIHAHQLCFRCTIGLPRISSPCSAWSSSCKKNCYASSSSLVLTVVVFYRNVSIFGATQSIPYLKLAPVFLSCPLPHYLRSQLRMITNSWRLKIPHGKRKQSQEGELKDCGQRRFFVYTACKGSTHLIGLRVNL